MQSPAALDALDRLVNHPDVTHAAVLEPHRRRTLQRMREYDGVVLVIHDTTELDYTSITSLDGLGQIGNGGGRGYQAHHSLAVAAESREILGLASQILFCRDQAPKREGLATRRRRPSRESRLWKQGSQAVGPPPPGGRWVDVCDRGGDLFEFIDHKHESGGDYIVRSQHDRWIILQDGDPPRRCKLHVHARHLPARGGKTVAVAARDGQPRRRAKLTLAAGAIVVPAPRQHRGEHRSEPLTVSVVAVGEIDPPPGADRLEWILLTNRPVPDLEAACQVVDWYACRPVVEEYHKALKTGCEVENLQLTTQAALQPMIALLSVVAVFLVNLRDASRRPDAATRPAREQFPAEHVALLSQWRLGEVRPEWTTGEFFLALARLGGHQNRRSDPAPGWLVLWRGWTKLQAMAEGAAAIRRMNSS